MFDQDFWNERYATSGYVYGTEPNSFLAEHHALLQGPVLSISEGEGRNAVFLAAHGLEVLGVDISRVALEKAHELAKSRGMQIKTVKLRVASLRAASRLEPPVQCDEQMAMVQLRPHGFHGEWNYTIRPKRSIRK